MRLEGSFYTVESISLSGDGELRAVVELADRHPIFDGHFPSQAVVPGVCTLTILKECLRKVKRRDIMFTAIKECKYLSALLPGKGLKVELEFACGEETLSGMVKRCDDGQPVMKLKASYR